MYRILVAAEDARAAEELCLRLEVSAFAQFFACSLDDALDRLTDQKFDVVLVEVTDRFASRDLLSRIKQEKALPVIAGVRRAFIPAISGSLTDADDFILAPYDPTELEMRIKRLLHYTTKMTTGDLIVCGDLAIDPARCEVKLAGKEVELAFKEYELLRFLMTNRGRVYTREALLNRVWGDNYFGGDRTVDVHIRRLRSKIEDVNHVFIDTVRNIGYRFTDGDGRRNPDVTLP